MNMKDCFLKYYVKIYVKLIILEIAKNIHFSPIVQNHPFLAMLDDAQTTSLFFCYKEENSRKGRTVKKPNVGFL